MQQVSLVTESSFSMSQFIQAFPAEKSIAEGEECVATAGQPFPIRIPGTLFVAPPIIVTKRVIATGPGRKVEILEACSPKRVVRPHPTSPKRGSSRKKVKGIYLRPLRKDIVSRVPEDDGYTSQKWLDELDTEKYSLASNSSVQLTDTARHEEDWSDYISSGYESMTYQSSALLALSILARIFSSLVYPLALYWKWIRRMYRVMLVKAHPVSELLRTSKELED